MKLMRIGEKQNEKPCVMDEHSGIRDVSSIVPDFGPDTLCDELIVRLKSADLAALPAVELTGKRIGSPMQRPRTIFCIGLNYSDHAAEAKMDVPKEPILFSKASAAFSGPNDDILYSAATSKLDWEIELGIVIGKAALNVTEADAMDHVFGYTVVNELSERAWQIERAGQWIKGKSFPSFCPTGPVLVSKDAIPDPQNLDLWLDVNGERQQTGSTRLMIFPVPALVSYISRFALLEPGDLICTGTPPGVGMGKSPQKWLGIGDVITLGISHLGEQRQTVVAL
ncbi:MAG: fumarylacetoacetate hydrolase family protein [Rhizobiales bacterium]|nr:fumarylacetoacetate hydrolase family protein [Hyphomicrobiales bacterium]